MHEHFPRGAERLRVGIIVDRVPPEVGVRQWVLAFPFELRRKLGYEPRLLSEVLAVVIRALFGFVRARVRERAGPVDARDVRAGAVTQPFFASPGIP